MKFKAEGKEGAEEYFTKAAFKGEGEEFLGKGYIGSLKGLFIGFVGVLVDVAIDNNSNENEGEHFSDAVNQALESRRQDIKNADNNLNVIANES